MSRPQSSLSGSVPAPELGRPDEPFNIDFTSVSSEVFEMRSFDSYVITSSSWTDRNLPFICSLTRVITSSIRPESASILSDRDSLLESGFRDHGKGIMDCWVVCVRST